MFYDTKIHNNIQITLFRFKISDKYCIKESFAKKTCKMEFNKAFIN